MFIRYAFLTLTALLPVSVLSASAIDGQPVVTPGGVVNAASFQAPVAPGSVISVFGQNLAGDTYQASSTPLPTMLGATSVTVSGVPVPLIYVGASQINAQLPSSISPGQASLIVSVGGLASDPVPFTVASTAPGIFTGSQNQATIVNPDGSFNSAAHPVAPGALATLFLTGAGVVSPLPLDGSSGSYDPLSETPGTPEVTFGGVPGTVLFSGLAPCCVGLWQINVTVPAGAPAGNSIPLQVTLGGAAGNTATIAIYPPGPLDFSPVVLIPQSTSGTNYQQIFLATGGTPPNTWTLGATSGLLGLGISASGVLSGKPSMPGSYSLPITLKDSLGISATHTVVLKVNPPPMFMTELNLPAAMSGMPYSTPITVGGGTLPVALVAGGQSLPAGMGLSAPGAIVTLSGTPTTTSSGTASIVVTINDANGSPATATFSLPIIAPLTITTRSNLPPTSVGGQVSVQFAALGGSGTLTWSAMGLPSGVTMTSAGLLSGVVSRSLASTLATLSVQVADASGMNASQTCQLPINPAPVMPTTVLSTGIVGAPYTATLLVSGGTPLYTWSLSNGSSLPSGLALGQATGMISGVPTMAGAFSFQVQVTDSVGATAAQLQSLTLNVSPNPISITTGATLPAGFVGLPYQTTLAETGGLPPYTWTIISGSVPPGLGLDALTGILRGTPSYSPSTSFAFTVTVTDANNVSATQRYQVALVDLPPFITTLSQLGGSLGLPCSQTLSAAGGVPPYTWAADLGLSSTGLTLSPGGQITGTPGKAGVFPFLATMTDSTGAVVSRNFVLTIATTLKVVTTSVPPGLAGSLYYQQARAAGGVPPLAWTLTRTLYGGLALTSTGVIAGVPEASGVDLVWMQVTDQAGHTATAELIVTITDPLNMLTRAVPDGKLGSGYGYTLAAVGGATPYTWQVDLGTLPPGLSLNRELGTITGTPTKAGPFSFVVQLTDANGFNVGAQFQMNVN